MVRSALVEDIAGHRLLVPAAQRQLRLIIRTLQTRQRAVEHQLAAWLETAPTDWQDRVQTLCLVGGVGVLSALQLTAYLPGLGRGNRGQIAKLAALAPRSWDSGTGHGVRCIQQGRAPARRVLYQWAVGAARWNDTLRPHYQQLRARGRPAKPAYVAVARKLLIHLNALLRPTTAPGR